MVQNILARYGYGYQSPAFGDGEDVTTQNMLMGMRPQGPIANALSLDPNIRRDAVLPFESGTWRPAVPGFLADVINAADRVGSAPLLGAYNPAQRDEMIEGAGAVVGPQVAAGFMRNALMRRAGQELDSGGGRPSPPPLPSVDQPGIRAYHGSPHDFDRFSLDKIGTGEGAQAFGYGLYFAESEGVAKNYRDALANIKVAGQEPDLKRPDHWMAMALDAAQGDRAQAVADLRRDMTNQFPDNRPAIEAAIRGIEDENIPQLPTVSDRGRVYEVRINAEPDDFLDWDKPLSQQSEKVRQAVADRFKNASPKFTANFDQSPIKEIYRLMSERGIMNRNEQAINASAQLQKRGVAGIKYLDQGSRAAGDGSRNYVVFDDSLIQILRKYGLLPPVAAGAVAASSNDQAQAKP